MRDTDFKFFCVHLLCSKCHEISFTRGGWYRDFPDWIKIKKATISIFNKKYNKCFEYTATVTLLYEEIKKDPQRQTKIKPFIDKYNWNGINYPSEKDGWKKIEKNNVTIVLLIVSYAKIEKIYHTYVSKRNPNREKQVILLMISNGEGKHYLAAKKLSALLRGAT